MGPGNLSHSTLGQIHTPSEFRTGQVLLALVTADLQTDGHASRSVWLDSALSVVSWTSSCEERILDGAVRRAPLRGATDNVCMFINSLLTRAERVGRSKAAGTACLCGNAWEAGRCRGLGGHGSGIKPAGQRLRPRRHGGMISRKIGPGPHSPSVRSGSAVINWSLLGGERYVAEDSV